MWKRFDVEKPGPGTYLWRIKARSYDGMILQPEAFALMREDGWPSFAHWDGYKKTVPDGLEWSVGSEPKFGNLVLKNCPFCGKVPMLDYYTSDFGRGAIVGAMPWEANMFAISCCGLIGTRFRYSKLKQLVDSWNHRV